MNNKSFYYKRGIFCLFGGIFLSLVLSLNYILPRLGKEDLHSGAVRAFLARLSVWMDGYGLAWSFLAVGIAAVLYKTREYYLKKQDKVQPLLVFISVCFGFVNVAGLCMYHTDRLPMSVSAQWTVICSLAALGWGVIFYVIAYWALEWLDGLGKASEENMPGEDKEAADGGKGLLAKLDRHIFLTAFLVIMLCWLPWLIVYYPASMDNDVFAQLCSFLGFWEKSNHHPWFASCVIGTFYKIGRALGSENLGIFLFVLVRDVLMALIYARCVKLLKRAGLKPAVYTVALLFYAVTPVWGAYAKHAFKDTFCAALFCLYTIAGILLIQKLKEGKCKTGHFLEYGLSALIVSLFRNNCIYCIVPAAFLLFFFLLKKKAKWYQIVLILACIGMYFGYNTFIFNVGGVQKGSSVEALAIPLQQTARTVKYHRKEITDEEKQVIRKVLKYKKLPKLYDPVISDPIKNNIQPGAAEYAKDYLAVWGKMFLKYPVTYLEAACAQSYGYYAFTPKLPYGSGNMNSGMTIFHWLFGGGDENFSFHYNDKLEKVRLAMDKWPYVWEKIPVLNLTDTIAFYTWAIVIMGYYLLRKKRFADTIPIAALLIMVLTCMASPVNDCFRYYAPVAASMPALLMLFGKMGETVPDKIEEKENTNQGEQYE
ncbi:MAG: DUF6020 family protein [Bacteroidales bacterium]|nr:DUF6020 family protein [Clostridium sp.]MCM1202860.1 DUF6020 family protein [Bacteroidales bacterium]